MSLLRSWDTSLFRFINEDLHTRALDSVMTFITEYSYLLFLVLVLLILVKDRKNAFIVAAVSVVAFLLADWAGYTMKQVFDRPRPCHVLEGVNLLVGCGPSYAMPSNHATNAFAFASSFFLLTRSRLRYFALLLALAVAFSRPYVGVHYPADSLVGALLGVSVAAVVVQFYRWTTARAGEKPHSTYLIVLLTAVSVFRIYYILRGPMDLSPDEAHYWEWARRLDLSYYSKGPLIAYLIYIGTALFGDNVFGVRIIAAVLSVLGSVILYILGRDLYDEKTGAYAAMLFQVVPLFTVYGVVMTIDAPFVFLWLLSMLLLYRAATTNAYGYWILLGLSVGLGLLAKYTMALFYLTSVLFLLASKDHRRLLLTARPYMGVLISLLVFSPVIIWNAGHDWVTLRHTLQSHIRVDRGLDLSLGSFIEFAGSQLGVVTPLLFILMVYALIKNRKTTEGAFLFWSSVPVLLLFFAKSIQGKVQANWAMTGYLAGLIAFCAHYTHGTAGRAKKAVLTVTVALPIFLTAVTHYPSIIDLPPGLDPSARLRGWESLGEEVGKIRAGLPEPGFMFSDRYQVASELAFYVEGHPVTYCVNLGRRMNQYDLWPGPEGFLHYNAVFVTIGDTPMPEPVGEAFERYEKRLFSVYDREGRKLRDYSIFLGYDFKGIKEREPESF
jgi:membrane-associated phospholipid phosphatase